MSGYIQTILRISILGLVALTTAATARGEQPLFEVQTDITARSGEDLGHPRITTPLDTEAVVEFRKGDESIRLAVIVKTGAQPGCHPVNVALERMTNDGKKKETKLLVIACEGKPVELDGKKLGAPSMKISLRKLSTGSAPAHK